MALIFYSITRVPDEDFPMNRAKSNSFTVDRPTGRRSVNMYILRINVIVLVKQAYVLRTITYAYISL